MVIVQVIHWYCNVNQISCLLSNLWRRLYSFLLPKITSVWISVLLCLTVNPPLYPLVKSTLLSGYDLLSLFTKVVCLRLRWSVVHVARYRGIVCKTCHYKKTLIEIQTRLKCLKIEHLTTLRKCLPVIFGFWFHTRDFETLTITL